MSKDCGDQRRFIKYIQFLTIVITFALRYSAAKTYLPWDYQHMEAKLNLSSPQVIGYDARLHSVDLRSLDMTDVGRSMVTAWVLSLTYQSYFRSASMVFKQFADPQSKYRLVIYGKISRALQTIVNYFSRQQQQAHALFSSLLETDAGFLN